MSLPPRVLCRTGCGDLGDPELDFLCGDCHGDKVEIEKQKALLEYVQAKQAKEAPPPTNTDGATVDSPTRRRGPPKIDHHRAFDEFMARPRERDEMVVARECLFMERERQIRETSKLQLRRYMIATDVDEVVDPKEWGRYQYGAPRDVPRNDVDHATEIAAQIKLFCHWRKRTLTRKIMTRRQLKEEQQKAEAAARKALKKSERRKKIARLLPTLSKPSLSLKSLKKSRSSKVLAVPTDETKETVAPPEASEQK